MSLNLHPLRQPTHTQVVRTMIELDAALIASQHEPKRWRKITELRLDTLACLAQLEQAQDHDLERLAVIARNQHNAAKKLNIARRKTA